MVSGSSRTGLVASVLRKMAATFEVLCFIILSYGPSVPLLEQRKGTIQQHQPTLINLDPSFP